jgi:hypothetical protein
MKVKYNPHESQGVYNTMHYFTAVHQNISPIFPAVLDVMLM